MVETSIKRDSAPLSIYRQINSRGLYLIARNTFPFNVHFYSIDYRLSIVNALNLLLTDIFRRRLVTLKFH
jgi:hypothetical protein